MPEQTQIPRVLWAQQREHVLLTIAVPDIEKVDVKFEEDSVSFQGQTASNDAKNKNTYEIKINLYEKIDPETSKYTNIGQKFWRLLLKKKDPKGAFWPRLSKDKTRFHWLQTDFDHWKDEDESGDEEKPGFGGNFQDMFGGGMGGMPGMDMGMGMGDGSDEEEGDSDDEKETAMATENGTNAENNQGSNKTTDASGTTGTTTATNGQVSSS